MKFKSFFNLELGKNTNLYYDLLIEEDFDFKTKNIQIQIQKENDSILNLNVLSDSIIDLKIGVNAVIKSLEIISKTLNV